MATATDGTGIVHDATAGGALGADVAVADGSTVYARVKAIDAAGNEGWSGWSDGVQVDATAPTAPTGVASTLGAWVRDSATFTWTRGTDAGSGIQTDEVQLSIV